MNSKRTEELLKADLEHIIHPGSVVDKPDLASEPRFADMFARYHNQEELDTIVSAWAVNHDDYEAMHLLQGKGVPASAVLGNTQIARDPHLRERGFCVEDDHP